MYKVETCKYNGKKHCTKPIKLEQGDCIALELHWKACRTRRNFNTKNAHNDFLVNTVITIKTMLITSESSHET